MIASTILETKSQSYASLDLGLAAAFEDIGADDVVIPCGSLYLVGEFLDKILYKIKVLNLMVER
jgi:folylpolyglutamate synthase/dihydropteroate synthase